jgi:ATP-dependent helicase HrpA
MLQVQRVEQAYAALLDRVPPGSGHDAELEAIGWSIEELRVHLFAQRLGTAEPVSAHRITTAIDALQRAG